ncbi:hypothetical protein KKC17_01535 [Patescibacteria group bacterium]|nr:hypothetical protein [Patescibacteria group bacterium]
MDNKTYLSTRFNFRVGRVFLLATWLLFFGWYFSNTAKAVSCLQGSSCVVSATVTDPENDPISNVTFSSSVNASSCTIGGVSGTVSGATCFRNATMAPSVSANATYIFSSTGSFSVSVSATDNAGHISNTSIPVTVTTPVPGKLTFTQKPAVWTNSTTAAFGWSAVTYATSYLVYLDNILEVDQTGTSWVKTGLSAGSHTVIAYPLNSSGTGTSDSWTWGIDTVKPTCGTFSPNPSPWKTSGTQAFTILSRSDTGGSGINVDLSSNNCTTGSTNGSTCVVNIQDNAGNTGDPSTCTSPPNRVDATAPSQVSLSVSPSSTNGSFTISWTAATDNESGLSNYELWRAADNAGSPGTWGLVKSTGTSTTTTDSPATDGKWWYGVHAVNNAGGYSTETSAQFGIKDTVAPTCGTWSPTSSPWKTSGTQAFTLSGSTDSGSGINTSSGPCTTGPNNGNTCTVGITDLAGNPSTCTSPPNRVDATVPSQVTGLSVSPSATTGTFTISWSAASDAESGLSNYELWRAADNGGSPGSWSLVKSTGTSTTTTDSPATDGKWWYGVHAVNNAGGYSTETSAQFGIKDTVAPTPNPTTGYTSGVSQTSITWHINTPVDNSGGAGLSATPYSFDGGSTWQATSFLTESSLTCSTSYGKSIRTRDSLGNATTAGTLSASTSSCDVRSAGLSGNPSVSGWVQTSTFTYSPSCTAQSGYSLTSCFTQVSTSQGSSWSQISSSQTVGQTYTLVTGNTYRFRVVATDTGGTVTSAVIPATGDIQLDDGDITLLNKLPAAGTTTNKLRPTIGVNLNSVTALSGCAIYIKRPNEIDSTYLESIVTNSFQRDLNTFAVPALGYNKISPLQNGENRVRLICSNSLVSNREVSWTFNVQNEAPAKPVTQ